jgi:hypothetical protein
MSCITKLPTKLIALFLLCQLPLAHALDTTVTLTPDTTIIPTTNEVVTFGLPLAVGDVLNKSQIRVLIGTVEQRINVQDGLRWHWRDGSLRSVTIQMQGVNMTAGNVTLKISDIGRDTSRDLLAVPQTAGWTAAGATKNNLPFPRVFAVHDLPYLASTGLIPPYVPGSTAEGVGKLQSEQFDNNFGALNYATSTGSSWLFDRATAMLKAYMTTGNVKFLKEGFLAKQFYFTYVRNDGTPPAPAGGSGCWTYNGIACADGKMIYTQPAKLALALFGDNSQWTNQLINNMAFQSDLGWNQYGTRDLFSDEMEGFTERGAGIAGLAEVAAYEITGDATVLAHMRERIDSLRDMQQTPKAWDTANGWLPMSGAFTHSWARHEGDTLPPLGTTDDRRFSPWMSENIADFLWQAYQVQTDTAQTNKIKEILRRLGNAVELHAFMSSYVAGEGVLATYARKPGLTGSIISCGAPDNLAIELMYSASAYASAEALRLTQVNTGAYVDQHNVEVILPLALAFHFETDPATKKRLQARIEHMKRQWTSNPTRNCSTIFASQVYRLFNWQHRSNSVHTWEWVKAIAAPPPTLSYPGYVWVSVGTCVDGNSWHWQCKGQWVAGNAFAAYPLLATCGTTNGLTCANTGSNRRWTAIAKITATTFVLNCATPPASATVRSSCTSVRYLQAQ